MPSTNANTGNRRTRSARRAVDAGRAGDGRPSAFIVTAVLNVAAQDADVAFDPSAPARDRLQRSAAAIGWPPQLISVEPPADPVDRRTRHEPATARQTHTLRP